jgi:hypothetical protein
MPRLINRIDDFLIQMHYQRVASAQSGWAYRAGLLYYVVSWLHEWHAYEKDHQRERDYRVRERNQQRARELEGAELRDVSEAAWSEAGLDAKTAKAKRRSKRFKKWELERRPTSSFGLLASRMLLILVYLFAAACVLFVVGIVLSFLVCGVVVMFLPKKVPPNVAQVRATQPVKPPVDTKPSQEPPQERPKEGEPPRFLAPRPDLIAVDDRSALKSQTAVVEDVEFKTVSLGSASRVAWTADGRGLYVLRIAEGVVARVDPDNLVMQRSIKLGGQIGAAAVSAAGVLVATSQGEMLLLDANSLDVKLRIVAFGMLKVISGPTLSKAFVLMTDNTVLILDLDKREALGRYPLTNTHMDYAVPTPDGKYLFGQSRTPGLARYRIEDGKFTYEETGPEIGNGGAPSGINVSADGKLVCLPTSNANFTVAPNHPRVESGATYVYAVTDLSKPVIVLQPDAKLRGVAFDTEHNRIYGCNIPGLVMYDDKGQRLKTYAWPADCDKMAACLLNPKKRQLLLTANDRFCLVDWRRP